MSSKHPLDPLAASEITKVSDLLKSKYPGQSLHFKAIAIIEPPKDQLREYVQAERSGNAVLALARRATALYYHRGTANKFSATVNLDQGSIEEIKQLESYFHGQADMNEVMELRDACLAHPKVIERIEKYKLPDHLKVVCDTWPYGRDSKDHLPRYVQVSNSYTFGKVFIFTNCSATSSPRANIQVQTIMICLCHSLQC